MTGENSKTLMNFIKEYANHSKEDFLNLFPHPFLVVPGDQEMELPSFSNIQALAPKAHSEEQSATLRMSIGAIDEELPASFRKVVIPKAQILPLPFTTKEGATPTLTIGRTEINDLYFEDGEVSTNHASIMGKGEPPIYFIIDHGSTNKTYVNGAALVPHEEILLKDHSTIEIGLNRLFIFYYSETFYRCINLV